MFTTATFIEHIFGSPSHNNQKREKGNPNCKIKLSLFADDMILYLENPEDTTKKLLSSVQLRSHVQLFATPCTAARQASLSITNSWSVLLLSYCR